MKEKDIDHLVWIYNRLKNHYKENENIDYMLKFNEIIWGLSTIEQPIIKPIESYIEEAKKIIHGERNDSYGPMKEGFNKTALIWSTILNQNITAEQVCLCMIGLKLSREAFKHSDDNCVDMIGYLEIINEL